MNNLKLFHRHGYGQFLLNLGLLGEGVEVGTAEGRFAEMILEQWPGESLHLVDPWIKQDSAVYREITNENTNWESWFDQTKQRLARFGSRAVFHRMFSVECFPSKDQDFLRTNHLTSFLSMATIRLKLLLRILIVGCLK